MIAGLPVSSWLLLIASVVPALILVTVVYKVHAPSDRPQQEPYQPPDCPQRLSRSEERDHV